MRYFIVTYYQQASGKYNETVKVDTKIRNKDVQAASVIIDYEKKVIVKSRFTNDELGTKSAKDFDTINDFFKGHYPEMIAQIEAKYIVIDELMEGVKAKRAEIEAGDDDTE